MGVGDCGGGCTPLATASSLLAQGTVVGVLLALLIYFGVGVLALLILLLLLLLLLGVLCSFCACTAAGCSGVACCGCDGCEPCCEPCCDCSACSTCDTCGDCAGCSCGDCGDCGGCGGCGDCGGGAAPTGGGGGGGDCGCLAPAMAAGAIATLAHHPDRPEFEQDVYRVKDARLCIGCFTTYPVFMALAIVLFLVRPDLPWGPTLAIGGLLASAQAVSSLGLADTRRRKALVKTALGAGLALYVYATLVSPLGFWGQYALLWAALGLALVSTIPRTLRMRKARGASCRNGQCEKHQTPAA